MKTYERYLMILGALEGLSRVYLGLLKAGLNNKTDVIKKIILDYVLHLGKLADEHNMKEHIKQSLPGDPLTIEVIEYYIKKEKQHKEYLGAESNIPLN